MGFFSDNPEERFTFTIKVEPRSAGDFGAISIGGVYRSLKECFRDGNDMIDEMNRHVDGVDGCSITIEDIYEEYGNIGEYQFKRIMKETAEALGVHEYQLKWEDYAHKLPKRKKNVDELQSTIKQLTRALKGFTENSSVATNFPDECEYAEGVMDEEELL